MSIKLFKEVQQVHCLVMLTKTTSFGVSR